MYSGKPAARCAALRPPPLAAPNVLATSFAPTRYSRSDETQMFVIATNRGIAVFKHSVRKAVTDGGFPVQRKLEVKLLDDVETMPSAIFILPPGTIDTDAWSPDGLR